MTDSDQDARAALDMVAQSRQRAAEFRDYAIAGPILIAWGLTWIVANLTAQFAPLYAPWVWLSGIAASVLFTISSSPRRRDGRITASVATAGAFAAVLLTMVHGDARTQNATVALLVAAIYVFIGIWTGVRWVWIGLAIALAVILGWFVFPDWLYLCLGLGGGGALLLSGLWLRRA